MTPMGETDSEAAQKRCRKLADLAEISTPLAYRWTLTRHIKTIETYQDIQGRASRIVTQNWRSQKLSEAFALLACMEGLVECSREHRDTSGALTCWCKRQQQ